MPDLFCHPEVFMVIYSTRGLFCHRGLAWLNINQLGQQRELGLTSTETRMFIRDGDKGGRGRKSEGSIAGANPED